MSYLVLARKHRPQAFDEVVGQDHVIQTLKNAIESNRVAHALLFAGPRGVGKTSVARIMAKAMNCSQGPGPTPRPCNACPSCNEITAGIALDVLEIDGASNRGINEIRELRENVKYKPSRGRFKIYIIDEIHMLTAEAFNALLKTLEEPPAHTLFFFATTEPNKIPATIVSRCQRHNFKRIPTESILDYLETVSQKSSFRISRKSLALLAREASGSMRDALSLLDQIMAYAPDEISDEDVLEALGALDTKALSELSGALLDGDVSGALNRLDDLYNRGYDLKRLYRQLLETFRHLLVIKLDQNGRGPVPIPTQDIDTLRALADQVPLEALHQIFSMTFDAEAAIRYSEQPKLVLEALFIKLLQQKRLTSLDRIIAGIDRLARGATPETAEQRARAKSSAEHAPKTAAVEQPQADPAGAPKDLNATWSTLLSHLDQQCRFLLPSLHNATLTKIEDNALEIVVRGTAFDAARLCDKKNQAKLEAACRRFFGKDMTVRIKPCIVNNNEKSPADTDKARRLKKEALRHPLIADALEVFHGTVVDVRIL
ncbi:MAG: DNA polymerase III subunit gamma/tau [Deltaproteobacteria bacterium]|nr:DNA polymerase III subunit gamma/tau [Deltaproteobacteria bacterium]